MWGVERINAQRIAPGRVIFHLGLWYMTTSFSSSKRDRFDQLCAVAERFHSELAALTDDCAADLCSNWQRIKLFYAEAQLSRRPTRSQLAGGLEQGLREMPELLAALPAASRQFALRALAAAFRAEYPAFMQKDHELLARIRAHKSIRNESEYYLVRYHIDLLEGNSASGELAELYGLADVYETGNSGQHRTHAL